LIAYKKDVVAPKAKAMDWKGQLWSETIMQAMLVVIAVRIVASAAAFPLRVFL
jgi:hypothetical protein